MLDPSIPCSASDVSWQPAPLLGHRTGGPPVAGILKLRVTPLRLRPPAYHFDRRLARCGTGRLGGEHPSSGEKLSPAARRAARRHRAPGCHLGLGHPGVHGPGRARTLRLRTEPSRAIQAPEDSARQPLSTEQNEASTAMNAGQAAAVPEVKVEWSRVVYKRWKEQTERLASTARRDGGGPNPASP